ncbi:MAG TPA: thioredoxin family protein [Casimicrobiaceae bacterium]|jgi:thiol-disulfide isomerase/thioredoxin
MMNARQIAAFAAVLAVLGACQKAPDPTAAPKPKTDALATTVGAPTNVAAEGLRPAGGIAWQKGDVDAAFASAKTQNKPVFLYWGAVWCPPCNQVKATIFNRQDFIERSRFFVPVYIDGDGVSAQKLGDRFKVSGYPTMILFKPDGSEITRLPGEVDAEQYMRVLAMGINGARPVRETLAAALSPIGDRTALSAEDWRMLAYYSWDTDEHRLVAAKALAPTLRRLAQACPADQPDTAARLRLRALAAAATAKDVKPREDPAAVADLRRILTDAVLAQENFDLLTYYGDKVVAYVTRPHTAARSDLVSEWNAVLERFVADPAISTADRLSTLSGRIALAKLDHPKGALADPLLQSVRDEVTRADRETTDPYARQAVISAAADALAEADLMNASDALLQAELKRSHAPYYFMLDLAANAKKRGDKAAALDWEQKAYAAADGPATRLQWGVHYVKSLIDLTPQDEARIEQAATRVIGELDPTPDTFYERNRVGLERLGDKLAAWNAGRQHQAALARIRAQMDTVCAKLPSDDPARSICDGVMRHGKRTSA